MDLIKIDLTRKVLSSKYLIEMYLKKMVQIETSNYLIMEGKFNRPSWRILGISNMRKKNRKTLKKQRKIY